MFNRKAIMVRAWQLNAEYIARTIRNRHIWPARAGKFSRTEFAACLRDSWAEAHRQAERDRLASIPAKARAARIRQIDYEIAALDYSDTPITERQRALRAERASLAA